jgi:glycosyltransferase involved in cell wall biosynthesis
MTISFPIAADSDAGTSQSVAKVNNLSGRRAAVIVFAYYPSDVRVMRSAVAMQKEGMAVDLFCLQQFPTEPSCETIDGVEVFRFRLKKRRGGKAAYAFQYLVFILASFVWLSRHGIRRWYDIVHVHNMPDFLAFSAVLAKALGSRVVLDLHDPSPEVFRTVYDLPANSGLIRLLLLLEKWSIAFADKVLTPNVAFWKLFSGRSASPGKVEIVMNTPLEDVFPFTEPGFLPSSPERVDKKFVVMYHGTLVERHGLHTAIEAVAQLRERIPGLYFHIYGEETAYMREKINPLISALSLNDRVIYFGEQSQASIASAIRDCSLGVVPNLRTVFTEINFPTRIFEYLALGKPVIVPETQGIKDYFDSSDMLFFTGGDMLSLRSQMEWVFDHPSEVQDIVREGQKVYQRHLWSRERERLLALFAGLISKPHAVVN